MKPNKRRRAMLLAGALLAGALLAGCTPQQRSAEREAEPEIVEQDDRLACDVAYANGLEARKTRVRAQIREMTVEEKVGQLLMTSIGAPGQQSTSEPDAETLQLIADKKIGSIVLFDYNINTEEQTKALVLALKKASLENSDHPLLLAIDEEGGSVSRLPRTMQKTPSAAEIGATGDPERAYEAGRQIASNMRKLGLNLNLAPVADVRGNKENPVIGSRAFSEDPEVVAEMAGRFYDGLKEGGVFAAAKHFPGHGNVAEDSHASLPVLSKDLEALLAEDLVPFQTLSDRGIEVLMTAHIVVEAIDANLPMTLSQPAKQQLREAVGYEGILLTDDLNMAAITNGYSIEEAAVRSLASGSDLLMIAHDMGATARAADAIVAEVEAGEISIERVDDALFKVLMLKGSIGK